MSKKPTTLNLAVGFESDVRSLVVESGSSFEVVVPDADYRRRTSQTPRKDGVIFPISIMSLGKHLYQFRATNFHRLMIRWIDPFGPEISAKKLDLWITLEATQPDGVCRIHFSSTRQEKEGFLSLFINPKSGDLSFVTPQDPNGRTEKLEVDRDCHLIFSGTYAELYSLVIRRLGEKHYLFQITPTHIGR